MAIALDAATSSSSTASSTLTFSHTVAGSDRVLMVGVSWQTGAVNNATVTGVTYNGVAMTLVDEQAPPDPFNQTLGASLWRLVAPATGTHNVVITISNTSDVILGGATSWTGVDQTTPLGTSAKATAQSGTTATVNVSSATGEVVVDVVIGLDPISVGAGQTSRYATTGIGLTGAGSSEPGAGTVTMSWTVANYAWRIVAVPLKPVAAAAGNPWYWTRNQNALVGTN